MRDKPTEFEMKVMRYAERHHRLPLGDKRVAWAGAARRLQGRGWLDRLSAGGWFVTWAGTEAMGRVEGEGGGQ